MNGSAAIICCALAARPLKPLRRQMGYRRETPSCLVPKGESASCPSNRSTREQRLLIDKGINADAGAVRRRNLDVACAAAADLRLLHLLRCGRCQHRSSLPLPAPERTPMSAGMRAAAAAAFPHAERQLYDGLAQVRYAARQASPCLLRPPPRRQRRLLLGIPLPPPLRPAQRVCTSTAAVSFWSSRTKLPRREISRPKAFFGYTWRGGRLRLKALPQRPNKGILLCVAQVSLQVGKPGHAPG